MQVPHSIVRTILVITYLSFRVTSLTFCQDAGLSQAAQVEALRRRAEKGDAKAQVELGIYYEYGFGVEKNYAEALVWFRKAVALGNTSARFRLGEMYLAGRGVVRDLIQAANWYSCPKISEAILGNYKATVASELPREAYDLAVELKCSDACPDFGYVVDLKSGGPPAYVVGCHLYQHGPCSTVLIGKVGAGWKDLQGSEGIGFDLLPLEGQHGGYHDICLPNVCSPAGVAAGRPCTPEVLEFHDGRYREARQPAPKPPQ